MGEVIFLSISITQLMNWKKDFGEKCKKLYSQIKCKIHRHISGEFGFFQKIANTRSLGKQSHLKSENLMTQSLAASNH